MSNENIMAKQMKYIEELRKGIVRVNFTTVGGQGREMYCTRNSEYISKYIPGNSNVYNRENLEKDLDSGKITVFDCEIKEFRSFKVDNVNLFEIYSYNLDTKLPNELMKDVYRLYYTKQKEVLENYIVKVTFRKACGTTRVLYGTRNKGFIRSQIGKMVEFDDEQDLLKGKFNMSLFDLEKKEVRRYSLSRLKNFMLVDFDIIKSHMVVGRDLDVDLLEKNLYRRCTAKSISGLISNVYDFSYLVLNEEDIKYNKFFDENNLPRIFERVTDGHEDFVSQLENVLSFNYGSFLSSKNTVTGNTKKGEIELTIKLDGDFEGAQIKSFQIVGNEVKLVLNVN